MVDTTELALEQLESVCCELCGQDNAKVLFSVKDKYSESDYSFLVVRCRNCHLVYVNPRPTQDDIIRFYPDEYYNAEVMRKKVSVKDSSRLEERRLGDIGKFKSGGRILDVGCGAGQFLSSAKSAGWETLGIELSDFAVAYARDQFGLEIIQKDLLTAELPAESFDVVTMWGVVEHLHHPKAALQEAARLLKPEGLFVALVPNIGSSQMRIFGADWYLLDVPRHLYHFSDGTLAKLAECAGLRRVWGRYFALEHDRSNFVKSAESVLFSRKHDSLPHRFAWQRVLMGLIRRTAPMLTRTMALRRASAAIEVYFVK